MSKIIRIVLFLISLTALGSTQVPRSFLKLETGVSGGIVFHRDTALLIVPNGAGQAIIWLEDHGHFRRGRLTDYPALTAQIADVYRLRAYEPSFDLVDPYGERTALHAHDGSLCFSYSPQRGCDSSGERVPAPSERERARFRQVCARLQKLEAQATIPVTEEQFREAEQAIGAGVSARDEVRELIEAPIATDWFGTWQGRGHSRGGQGYGGAGSGRRLDFQSHRGPSGIVDLPPDEEDRAL